MGIGQRFQRLFGSGRAGEADPGAMREAGVVPLAGGPMLVDHLRDRGIDAVGIESVDPVSGVRSYLRIMVRQSDLAAARQVLEERPDEATGAAALDGLTGDVDEDQVAAEEAAADAMSRLFLAADRLSNQPGDPVLVAEVDELAAMVDGTAPPFGVERLAWQRVASLAAAVSTAAEKEEEDEDEVRAAALALRDLLRQYV